MSLGRIGQMQYCLVIKPPAYTAHKKRIWASHVNCHKLQTLLMVMGGFTLNISFVMRSE